MTKYGFNKKGRLSDKLSRSKEDWERGSGARKKGNPSYEKIGSRYHVRKRSRMKSLI